MNSDADQGLNTNAILAKHALADKDRAVRNIAAELARTGVTLEDLQEHFKTFKGDGRSQELQELRAKVFGHGELHRQVRVEREADISNPDEAGTTETNGSEGKDTSEEANINEPGVVGAAVPTPVKGKPNSRKL